MKKANLNLKIFGVRNLTPQFERRAAVTAFIDNNSSPNIYISAYTAPIHGFKQREECFIEIQDFDNKSVFAGTFNDLLALIAKANQTNEDPDTITITWSIEDFESKAVENEENEQEEGQDERPILYDRSKFSLALKKMENFYDCNNGITWESVDWYLNEYCQINPIQNN
jgi:hypothetical protein